MLSKKMQAIGLLSCSFVCTGVVNAGEQPLRLGLGYMHSSSVFNNADSVGAVVPVARYESENVSVRGTIIDLNILSEPSWSAGIGFNLDSAYQDRNESKDFDSWSEIALRVNAHVFASANFTPETIGRIAYSYDVSGESKGYTATADLRREFRLPIGAKLIPTVGLKWFDQDTFEYLFTNDDEIEGDSALNPYLSLSFIMPVSERFAVMSNFTWYQLDSKINKLDVIDSDSRYTALFSVLYRIN